MTMAGTPARGSPAPPEFRPVEAGRRTARAFGLFVWLLVALTLAAMTVSTTRIFERAMVPQLARNASVMNEIIVSEVERALKAGVPIDRLVDMQGFVASVVESQRQVRRVTLRDPGGRILFDGAFHAPAGTVLDIPHGHTAVDTSPVVVNGETLGTLSIEIASDYLKAAVADIGLDVFTILLAIALVTFEVVLAVTAIHVARPIADLDVHLQAQARGMFRHVSTAGGFGNVARSLAALNARVVALNRRYAALLDASAPATGPVLERLRRSLAPDGRPIAERLASSADLRLPLVLFFLATELSRGFLPLLADDLYATIPGIERSFLLAAPMTAYVLASLLPTPLAGVLINRFGVRRTCLLGMIPTVASLAGEGLATDLIQLTLWRLVEGIGFSLVSIAALEHIRITSVGHTRASAAVIYGAAFVTGGICGTSVGSILADRAGFSGALYIAAALAAGAMYMALRVLVEAPGQRAEPVALRWSGVGAVLRTPRFMTAALLLAWPAQMVVTGFVYYATPLLLHDAGVGTSAIGRIVMAYFLTNLVVGWLAARWADANGRHRLFAGAGLALAGLGAVLPAISNDTGWLVCGVAIVGLAQAIGGPSRGAIMLEECARISQVPVASALGLFRVLERGGALVGPLFVAAIVPWLGFREAIVVLGVAVILAAAGYAILNRRFPSPDRAIASGDEA